MSQPTICIREIAKRRIRTEYKRAEPRLTRVLAHYAVYQRATSIIDNRHNAEMIERSQKALQDIQCSSDNEESRRLWRYSPVSKTPDYRVSPSPDAETSRWSLPGSDRTLNADDARRSFHIVRRRHDSLVQQKIPAQSKDRFFNPLRQNPPGTKCSYQNTRQPEHATVPSVTQIDIHRKIIVLQMTQVLLKALRKLGVFISHGHSIEEEPDVEAQIHVNVTERTVSCRRYPDYDSKMDNGPSVFIVCGPGV